jgi:hypothetical protein
MMTDQIKQQSIYKNLSQTISPLSIFIHKQTTDTVFLHQLHNHDLITNVEVRTTPSINMSEVTAAVPATCCGREGGCICAK